MKKMATKVPLAKAQKAPWGSFCIPASSVKSLAPHIVLQIAMVVLYVWGGVGRLVGIDQQRVENSMLPVNCLPEYFHKSKLILLFLFRLCYERYKQIITFSECS